MRRELSAMVARSPFGQGAAWPVVETVQRDGICHELVMPARIDGALADRAAALGTAIAERIGATGMLAVELFLTTDGDLVVNELAARPHNSGHATIDASVTSQFENHLRAVLDLPLGSPAPQHAQVASVNVFGGAEGEDPLALLPLGLATEGAHIHLYGKGTRPGRKLGHVTVCGDHAEEVRERAWAAAMALGTPRPQALRTPAGQTGRAS